MSKHEREHQRAAEFTELLKNMVEQVDFLEGHYKTRPMGFREVIEKEVMPRMKPTLQVVFNSRAKEKWHLKAGELEFHRFGNEEELEQALQPQNYASTGSVLGQRLLWVAEQAPIGEHLLTRMDAHIMGSYGKAARIWLATGFEDFKQSSNKSYFTCVGRYAHGLHDLNQCSIHFCYGVVTVSYHWSDTVWSSSNAIHIKDVEWPESLIQTAPGRRAAEIFDIPFIGEATIRRAWNFSSSLQVTVEDEMKTINEWIAEGVL